MAMQRVRVLTSLLSRLPSGADALRSLEFQQRRSLLTDHHPQWRRFSGIRVDQPAWKRCFSSANDEDFSRELDDINSKFAEAREEIELALESKETVYFNEEAETARLAVQEVLDKYEALLGKLSPENKGVVQRSMGLKMEQLKAELAQLKE